MARLFNNRYPYTDLHELNIGWCVQKITDFEARVTDVEEDVETLKGRATALETRMTAAEGTITTHTSQIGALQTASTSQAGRILALENADIQDAAMLASVSSVEAGNASVTVNFSAAAYADGVKTAGTDAAVIPAATSSAAGVMLPGEKQKLAPISVSGNDVTFAGHVAGSAPSANNDFATKQYVDNLAITGSATLTYSEVQMQSDHGSPSHGVHDCKIYRYGAVRAFVGNFSLLTVTSDISVNNAVAYVPLTAGDLPPVNTFHVWAYDQAAQEYTFDVNVSRTTEKIAIVNRSGRTITTDDYISFTPITIFWLVE